MLKSKRSKATDITPKVRREVIDRDGGKCIFCGSPHSLTIAHFIARSSGGLGIKQNLTLTCAQCHLSLDQGTNRKEMRQIQKAYLDKLYPNFDDEQRKYHKWK